MDAFVLNGIVDIVNELVGDLGEHAALCPDQIILYLAGGAGDDLRDKQVIRRVGRLREDTMFDYKFVCLSHNTLRGAAGGGVLLAELLAAKGYMD